MMVMTKKIHERTLKAFVEAAPKAFKDKEMSNMSALSLTAVKELPIRDYYTKTEFTLALCSIRRGTRCVTYQESTRFLITHLGVRDISGSFK